MTDRQTDESVTYVRAYERAVPQVGPPVLLLLVRFGSLESTSYAVCTCTGGRYVRLKDAETGTHAVPIENPKNNEWIGQK